MVTSLGMVNRSDWCHVYLVLAPQKETHFCTISNSYTLVQYLLTIGSLMPTCKSPNLENKQQISLPQLVN